ncbi:hypothetical protein TI05_16585 [Achromatium sp. WMS3]|nr:hypothetical protein TI05_16585 [Achromatium sp. WMS3]
MVINMNVQAATTAAQDLERYITQCSDTGTIPSLYHQWLPALRWAIYQRKLAAEKLKADAIWDFGNP